MANAPLYTTAPSSVAAEQYTTAKTSMALVHLDSATTDYDTSPVSHYANVASLANPDMHYRMNDTDWVVIGPNFEAIYDNAAFNALYDPVASGNAFTVTVGADVGDAMTVTMTIYVYGGSGSANIDWGDGSTHSTPALVAGTNGPYSHTYTGDGVYSILVTYLGVGVAASFDAATPVVVSNVYDISDVAYEAPDTGTPSGLAPVGGGGVDTPDTPFAYESRAAMSPYRSMEEEMPS